MMSVLAVVRTGQGQQADPHAPTAEQIANYAQGPCTKCECHKFTSNYFALCQICGHLEYLHRKSSVGESGPVVEASFAVGACVSEPGGSSSSYASSSSEEEEEEEASPGDLHDQEG